MLVAHIAPGFTALFRQTSGVSVVGSLEFSTKFLRKLYCIAEVIVETLGRESRCWKWFSLKFVAFCR